MSIDVKVPVLPESVTDATVATWHKQAGESVRRDENLVDLETDKVVLEVPAPCDGVLKAINKDAGEVVTNNEVLATIESLRADPGTASVRVVVVDLRGSPLDDGFGAAALERALEMIESWGAEAILTGVSPLSEATVQDLETAHLLMRKDLPEAIASAFQIADAQRHLL